VRLARRAHLAGLALGALAACAPSEPTWVDLTRQGFPEGPASAEPRVFELHLPPERWTGGPAEGGARAWSTPRPAFLPDFLDRADQVGLRAGSRSFRPRRGDEPGNAPGTFELQSELVLTLAPEEPLPADLFFAWVARGGVERDGAWRATVRQLAADALPASRTLVVDVPPHSALRLATVAFQGVEPGQASFRVLLEGRPLLEHAQAADLPGGADWHALPLPEAGLRGARLEFEIGGDPALALFAAPRIGPAEVGSMRARPWGRARPSVLLVVADTLRADCLAMNGGDARWMPRLNELAARAVRATRARSSSTWTLPAHGTLLSGLYPTQHGLHTVTSPLSAELETLAEVFARAGYRTAAVTDSVFVSRRYGLDAGFEWFEEHWTRKHGWTLEDSLAAARRLLAADDGRPLFLLLHTYRVHSPYRAGREEDEGRMQELAKRVRRAVREEHAHDDAAEWLTVRSGFAEEYRAAYLEGVQALDASLGAFVAELEAGGFFANGYLLFTSDHGEAFFEHGRLGHNLPPHEEQLRIPLLLFGGGLAPREIPHAVSLADVAPTLADLCAVPRSAHWRGPSILALDHERPSFSLVRTDARDSLGISHGERKILVEAARGESLRERLARGEPTAAFHLAHDPRELEDRLHADDWPEEMARALAAEWAALSRPLVEAAEIELDEATVEELRALGY